MSVLPIVHEEQGDSSKYHKDKGQIISCLPVLRIPIQISSYGRSNQDGKTMSPLNKTPTSRKMFCSDPENISIQAFVQQNISKLTSGKCRFWEHTENHQGISHTSIQIKDSCGILLLMSKPVWKYLINKNPYKESVLCKIAVEGGNVKRWMKSGANVEIEHVLLQNISECWTDHSDRSILTSTGQGWRIFRKFHKFGPNF